MVLYFSGTGNSRYIARRVAEALTDALVDLSDYTREKKGDTFHSDKAYVLVVPAYSSYIPLVVEQVLEASTFDCGRDFYLLMTCGGTFSRAGVNLRLGKVLEKKGLRYRGIKGIHMPENYITLFAAPPENVARRLIEKATAGLGKIVAKIAAGKSLYTAKFPSFFAYVINKNFYKTLVTDKYYYATDDCIGCGKCQRLCPLNNIEMVDGKPNWQGDCTQCMACIGACPKACIEYGDKAKGKRRYYLE